MITCPDCQKKRLVWVTTAGGEEVLYELGAPHFVHCSAKKDIAAVRKNGATAPRRPAKSGDGPATEAAKLLKDMQYTATEATDMLKDIPEGPPEDMVVAALTKKGKV